MKLCPHCNAKMIEYKFSLNKGLVFQKLAWWGLVRKIGRCKKLEMEKHKLIAALLIYAECENDGSGDMYYNYDIARTTLSEIGHESVKGL